MPGAWAALPALGSGKAGVMDPIVETSPVGLVAVWRETEAPGKPFAYASEPVLELKKAHFHTPGIVQMEEQAKAFKDAEHDGLPLDRPPFELLPASEAHKVVVGVRIGISKAMAVPWRFGLAGSRFVSRRFP